MSCLERASGRYQLARENALAAIKIDHPGVVVIDLPLSAIREKFACLPSQDVDVAYVVVLPETDPRDVVALFHNYAADVVLNHLMATGFERLLNARHIVKA